MESTHDRDGRPPIPRRLGAGADAGQRAHRRNRCYQVPRDATARREQLRRLPDLPRRKLDAMDREARPVQIGNDVWIGFECCVLPGVTIGDGAIVGARSVVDRDVEPYTVVAGNPARFVRRLPRPSEAVT
jgi:acetyltransferase-like isoleucine patch superfamily enzyme